MKGDYRWEVKRKGNNKMKVRMGKGGETER